MYGNVLFQVQQNSTRTETFYTDSCGIKKILSDSESKAYWQTDRVTSSVTLTDCKLPLSSVLFLSQYWMVNSLIKRLELLFLRVFAWPKASRIQLTCIFEQTNGNVCHQSFGISFRMTFTAQYTVYAFLFQNNDINFHIVSLSLSLTQISRFMFCYHSIFYH